MNCIIVDDEPLAREGIKLLVEKHTSLAIVGSFNNADSAKKFITEHQVDLIFLDIQMPGTNGIDFARSVAQQTLVIFTTAYVEFALDSYEVEAIDYLVKPVKEDRFKKAVDKAAAYFKLLSTVNSPQNIEQVATEYFFVKADRKIFKLYFTDILIIEGLKDYVVLHTNEQKIITAMNIKTIHDQLPKSIFVRVSKSYIINVRHIVSFDNNSVIVQKHEVPIGNAYRTYFFDEFVAKKLLGR
ncbi:MAG: LytTR family DNA-binding domain-containing protein [Flavipsychrobacter sp.]|nr:LytTR family DNA-binding domain-containing protein [Flavipsychrobacter sp.]